MASEGGQGTDPGSIQTVTSLQDDSRRQKAADSVVQEATGGLRFAAKAIDAESSFISALSASQLSMNDTLNTSKGGSDVSNLSMKLTEWWHMQVRSGFFGVVGVPDPMCAVCSSWLCLRQFAQLREW